MPPHFFFHVLIRRDLHGGFHQKDDVIPHRDPRFICWKCRTQKALCAVPGNCRPSSVSVGKTDSHEVDRDRSTIMTKSRAALKTMYAQVLPCRKRPPLINTGELIIPSQCLRRLQHGRTRKASLEKKDHAGDPYTVRLFLPLSLLLLSTSRPEAVCILARKPCTLDLCLFLGWYVIFIRIYLQN